MQSSQTGLFWETAHLICGVTKTVAEQTAEKDKAAELELEKLKATATATAAAAAAAPASSTALALTTGRKFTLESVMDQTDKTELVVMTSSGIA